MAAASPGLGRQLRKFLRFEGVSLEIVVVTALISYGLQINAIISGQPLYLIAFLTLLPWIPLCVFEGIWKVKNYAMIAVLGLFTILQIGHFAEHLIQVLQIHFMNGTVACPPPVDNLANAARAVEMGLRDAALEPSFGSVARIVMAGPDGLPVLLADGSTVSGPAACAVFGQLDLELVHLIWEIVGYCGTAFALLYFPRNVWLYIAFLFLSWHALEHFTITYFYYFDQAENWNGMRQLWATVPGAGQTFTAVPAGKVEGMLNFYEAGGKFGLMANGGLFELLTGIDGMPNRPELHMGYNLAITVPTLIGFFVEIRRLRNRYLEQVFGDLSKDQIAALSHQVDDVSFHKGDVIMREREVSTECFLVKEGQVSIVINHGTAEERVVARIGSGQLLGEMGLLEGKPRSATAIAETKCEFLRLSAKVFAELINPESDLGSNATLRQVRRIAEQRREVTAVETSAT